MKSAVAIIIVTYNRVENLRVTLQACLSQGDDIHLFVVDNASTDGTAAYITQLASVESRLTVIALTKNSGGAGGFHEGMRVAYEAGYTWLWVMDDDVIPVPGALSTLLEYGKIAKCIYPAKECADGSLFTFEGRISRNTLRRSYVHNLPELAGQGWAYVNSANFEGAFIHRDVVATIGLPESSFFICWDDTLYGMKAAEHFACIYINTVCIKKQFDKERISFFGVRLLSSTVFSRYYFFRNYWFVMNYLRNTKELSPLAYVRYAILLVKTIAMTIIFDCDAKGAVNILKGAWYGFKGRFVLFSSLK